MKSTNNLLSNQNLTSEPGPLVRQAIVLEEAAYLKDYRNAFAKDHTGPYAIQWPDKEWKTRWKPVSDPLLKAHLVGKYSVAVKAPWYVQFGFLDFDYPQPNLIQQTIETLGLNKGQYLLMTSPSWWESKNTHLVFPVVYNEKFPTQKLYQDALRGALGQKVEIYPQTKRKFRLPFGLNQYLLGDDGYPMGWLSWKQAFDEVRGLEPFPLENLPFTPPLFSEKTVSELQAATVWGAHPECHNLWAEGLPSPGSRHQVVWKLASWFYRQNATPEEATNKIVRWLRRKHNGYSKACASGKWDRVKADVGRAVKWIWENYRPYPDGPHNQDGAVTVSDLAQAVELFPGDVVNQKRLLGLIAYYRPRRRHVWVYIPWDQWRDGINWDNVDSFRQTLEQKGVMDSINSYRHVPGRPELSFSRRYRLKLDKPHDTPVDDDGRNVTEYYQVVDQVCATVNDAVQYTGVRKELFYRAKKRRLADKAFDFNRVTFPAE